MLKERVELVVGKVTEAELDYAMSKITMKINNDNVYYDNDFHLYDILIESILDYRYEGVQNV